MSYSIFSIWMGRSTFAEIFFFESGQLESAIFNAATDTTITLAHSGVVLSPGSVTNPICIVANYLVRLRLYPNP